MKPVVQPSLAPMTGGEAAARGLQAHAHPPQSGGRWRYEPRGLQHLQGLAVEGDDLGGIVREEDVVAHPRRRALVLDHRVHLAAEVAPEFRVEEHVGHARTDAELEVAELDADLLEGADAADVEDTKVGRLEPFLAEVARVFLEGVEEIHAKFWRLGLEFEEAG